MNHQVHYCDKIPRLSSRNSVELYGEKFWIQKDVVYKAWRSSDGALVTLAPTKEKLIELLEKRYKDFI